MEWHVVLYSKSVDSVKRKEGFVSTYSTYKKPFVSVSGIRIHQALRPVNLCRCQEKMVPSFKKWLNMILSGREFKFFSWYTLFFSLHLVLTRCIFVFISIQISVELIVLFQQKKIKLIPGVLHQNVVFVGSYSMNIWKLLFVIYSTCLWPLVKLFPAPDCCVSFHEDVMLSSL